MQHLIDGLRVGALQEKRALLFVSDEDEGVRGNRTLSFFATLLLALGPHQLAFAQGEARNVSVADRQHPEYDPLGLRFGGFQLNASVEVGAEHSNNLFAEEAGNEDEDTYYNVRPEARLTSLWSRHAAYVGAGGSFSEHDEFSTENADTGYATAGGRIDVRRNTAVGVDLRAAREVESRTDPDSIVTAAPVEYDVRSASGYVSQVFNRVTLRLSAAQTDYDFHDAGAPGSVGFEQDYRDRSETTIGGRVEYAFTPRLAALAEAISEDREYDVANVTPSSDGVRYLAGVAFELSNLLRGELTAGQFERDYKPTAAVPDVSEVSGTAIAGRVNWFATPITTVSFNASRDVQESSFENPYVNTYYAGRIDHELLRNVVLTAGVGASTRAYEGIDRDDDVVVYDIGARYLMNRRVSFNAAYIRNETESDGLDAFRSYDEDHLRFAVKFAL